MLVVLRRFYNPCFANVTIRALAGCQFLISSTGSPSREYFTRFGVSLEPEAFVASPAPSFPPRAREAADVTLEEVNDFWNSMDMEFPLQQVARPR